LTIVVKARDGAIVVTVRRHIATNEVCVDRFVDSIAGQTGECAEDEVQENSLSNGQGPDGSNAAEKSRGQGAAVRDVRHG
ncbi:MAG TPA: hypothetical protein VII30_00180, partial [Gemmatimonadaceae bacterium]